MRQFLKSDTMNAIQNKTTEITLSFNQTILVIFNLSANNQFDFEQVEQQRMKETKQKFVIPF